MTRQPPTPPPILPIDGVSPPGHCQTCGHPLHGLTVGEPCGGCGKVIGGLCRGCGYDLVGLRIEGPCPECAKPIVDSIRGDLLDVADRSYVETLHRGVIVVLASILFLVLSFIVMFVALAVMSQSTGRSVLADFFPWLGGGIVIVGSVLSVYGWYTLSTPDPGRHLLDRGERPRRIVRLSVIAGAAVSLADEVLQISVPALNNPGPGGPTVGSVALLLSWILMIAGLALWVVQFFAAMLYLQWLAARLPSPTHVKRARQYMWLLPVLYVPGALLCGLGPLVALILYYNFLNQFRKSFKLILARHSSA